MHPDLSIAIKKAGDLGCNSITVDTNGYLFNDILFIEFYILFDV